MAVSIHCSGVSDVRTADRVGLARVRTADDEAVRSVIFGTKGVAGLSDTDWGSVLSLSGNHKNASREGRCPARMPSKCLSHNATRRS